MAIDHLLEGAQSYCKAIQDAARHSDAELEEFFRRLEIMSRKQAELAAQLLEHRERFAVWDELPRARLDSEA
jgi:hypothetical protein